MIGKYFVLFITIGAAAAVVQVPVAIYYETLCTDSMNFFTKQFKPTWNDLKTYMRVELVPSGKTNSSDYNAPTPPFPSHSSNRNFTCHHGPNECVGNRLQSCVVNKVTNEQDRINFIDCLMTKASIPTDYQQTVRTCKSSVSLDVESLLQCANGPEGSDLLYNNEQKTNRVEKPLRSVPTIVFNNRFDRAESSTAEKLFRSTLCKYITENPKPTACQGNGAPATTAGLITLVIAGFVSRMM